MRPITIAMVAALCLPAMPPGLASSGITQPQGRVRVSDRSLADDGGPFAALGASLFWAAWAYRHDRPRLDAHLELLSTHGFDYIRALGVVGRQPYWAGREIDWRWPDYKEVIAGLTDHAYDKYGLRVQWTIFGDADQMIPDDGDRTRLVDTFLAMARGREHKIIHFEIANEYWQNGFGGPEGLAQIRRLAAHLADRTDIPVAISASAGHECDDHLAVYRDLDVEILTEHFSRDVDGRFGRWGPALAPWSVHECSGLPRVVSNNEPIGPKSSVASETDPMRLIGAAISTYMGGVGLYVLHTDAGVRGHDALTDMPNAPALLTAFSALKRYLPRDVVNWTRYRHDAGEHPFVTYAGETAGAVWPDGHNDGAVEVLASVKASRFLVVPLGIINGLTLEARRPMRFDVLHPLTGERLEAHSLRAGEKVRLRPLPVLVLVGEFADAPPSPGGR